MSVFTKFMTVSGLTVLSRVFGVVREAMLSHFLGANAEMDAFLIAFKFPCFFRKCFAEGGFQSIFVPFFTDFSARNKNHGALYFSSRVFSLIFWVMLAFTIIVFIFAREFTLIMAPGFLNDPKKIELTTEFIRIIFPSIGFVTLATVYSSILISHKRFLPFALAPVLVNIWLMISLFVGQDILSAGRRISYGVLIAGIFQFFYLYTCVKLTKLTIPKLSKFKFTPMLRNFFKKLTPVLMGAGVSQINVFFGSFFCSFLPTGCITFIYFADRFVQLPLALFGISMGIILLPEIATNISKGQKMENLNEIQNEAILFTMRLTLPCVAALIGLAYFFVSGLYGHGKFSETAVLKTTTVLQIFSIGLPMYVASKVLSSVFFAQKDSKTPIFAGIWSIITNIILSAILIFPFEEAGIAIATTVSGFVNAYFLYKKINPKSLNKNFIVNLLKLSVSALIMFFIIKFITKVLFDGSKNLTHEIFIVIISCIIGFSSYIALLILTKEEGSIKFIKTIKQKIFKKNI